MYLEPFDKARIATAIAEAEARTSAEIVCVLARDSGAYALYPLVWAAALALVVPAPLIAFTELSAQRIFIAQIAAFVVAALAFSPMAVRMLLVPRSVKRAHGYDMALRQFRLRCVAGTRARTGILIFVSLAEHYARIMVDEAVAAAAAVPQHLWQESVNRLAAAMREDRVADGYVDAIESCAALLERPLPPEAADEDELANRIVLI